MPGPGSQATETGRAGQLRRRKLALHEATDGPADKAAVALDYLRAVAALAGRIDPRATEALLLNIAALVWNAGDELVTRALLTPGRALPTQEEPA